MSTHPRYGFVISPRFRGGLAFKAHRLLYHTQERARLKNAKNPLLWLEAVRLEWTTDNKKLAATRLSQALQVRDRETERQREAERQKEIDRQREIERDHRQQEARCRPPLSGSPGMIDSGLVGGVPRNIRCSRDTCPESYITEYTLVCEDHRQQEDRCHPPLPGSPGRSKRRGNNVKGVNNFHLNATARIWSGLYNMCRIGATAGAAFRSSGSALQCGSRPALPLARNLTPPPLRQPASP